MATPIFLVGFMGSGKSTIGRHLADALGYRFVDTDVFIETRFRQRILDMFAQHGEATFRLRERMVIEELMSMPDTVFATGGGLPCYEDTMEQLLLSGQVVYLSCSPQVLAARLELCKRTRPTIKDKSGEELLAFVEDMLRLRESIYRQAHHVCPIDEVDTPQKELRFARELASKLVP